MKQEPTSQEEPRSEHLNPGALLVIEIGRYTHGPFLVARSMSQAKVTAEFCSEWNASEADACKPRATDFLLWLFGREYIGTTAEVTTWHYWNGSLE